MIYRPYPPLPWWVLVTMIPPEMVLKCGKKALNLVKDAKAKARDVGIKHRTEWNERKAKWISSTTHCDI